MQQSQWVIETEAKLKLEVLTIEGLKRLLKQAAVMEQTRVVEVVARRIRDLLTAAHDWENEAKAAIKQRSATAPPLPGGSICLSLLCPV